MMNILQPQNAPAPLNLSKEEFLSSMAPLTTRDMDIYLLPEGDEIQVEDPRAMLNITGTPGSVELHSGDRVISRGDKVDVIRTYG